MSDNFFPITRKLVKSLIGWLETKPKLYQLVARLAKKHDHMMGYRKYGLMQDDIIPDDHPVVAEAISRLSDKEAFDRSFRIRRALQLNMAHESLPSEEQIPLEKDVPYLWKHIEDICQEREEKQAFDSLNAAQITNISAHFKSLMQQQTPISNPTSSPHTSTTTTTTTAATKNNEP